ncbi:YfaZ family outer membrane protein [Hydrogenimonas sp.]|uniref:YfaZ family outer membrane protein n=1 Tax=Hydrogenimonas sp. TaxID=2231112 RepID=UPI002619D73D|nr:YfaZ family outer membrane protein [Hydrogenimonas sp.]
MKKMVIGALCAALPLLAQHSAEININTDDIEVAGVMELSEGFSYEGLSSRNYLFARYLYSGESKTRDDNLVEAGFLATGNLSGMPALTLGIGIKGAFSEDYAAIPIGLTLRYDIPSEWQVALDADVYVAPSPLVFSDGDSYSAYRIGVSFRPIPNGAIYGGYRNIDLDYDKGSDDFNDGWYIGVRFYF